MVNPFYRIVVLTLASICVGTVASLGAIAFVEAVAWLNDLLLVSPRTRILYVEHPLLVAGATVLAPALGGLLVGLAFWRLSCVQRPLGPPDAIISVQTRWLAFSRYGNIRLGRRATANGDRCRPAETGRALRRQAGIPHGVSACAVRGRRLEPAASTTGINAR
ncbi:hypothetical protein [Chelativorans intermedius]|uniref:Chloride channel protein n=1 Tax=Chelativorans intermedius TaxID=515947 RepID=A0ABV6D9C8_9HYPH|nr:hypothetical protein [Chelativorans intermedius]MCT9000024.1 hypothetical protein [Chelativorans intermedius]